MSSDACVGLGCSQGGSWRSDFLNVELDKQCKILKGGKKDCKESIVVPKGAFGPVTLSKTFRFSLTVTDFLGNSIGKQNVRLDGLTGLKPAVSTDAGQRVQEIYYNTSLTISADAARPTCIEGGDVALMWTWTILTVNGITSNDTTPLLLLSAKVSAPSRLRGRFHLPSFPVSLYPTSHLSRMLRGRPSSWTARGCQRA